MKSLLAQALTVVECVRPLELHPSASMPGVFRLGCEVRHTPRVLRELALALEAFDAAARAGRDPTQVLAMTIRYAGEHGINVREMAEWVRGRLPGGPVDARTADVDPEHEPLPGQIEAPPRRGEETVDQANIRTRTGGIELAPQDTVEALPGSGVVLSEAAERMGEVVRSIGPGHRDAATRPQVPHHVYAKSRDHGPTGESIALMAEFRALEGRLGFLLEHCGESIQIERLREALAEVGEAVHGMSSGLEGGQHVGVAMLTTVMRVSNEIAAMEAELDMDVVPAPRMR